MRKFFKKAVLFSFFIAFIGGSLIFIRLFFLYQETKAIKIDAISLYETTKIYDSSGTLITTLGLEQRELVSYDEIAPVMIQAIISIEDQKFFHHRGYDVKGMLRALQRNLEAKGFKEGASTLTQQLVKLEFLSADKTLERKIKEIFLAIRLEKTYSKEEILELYLNRVLFGGRIYGVERASQYFFAKHARDLNYEEAALLAGIIQSPNRFNPYQNESETKARQNLVLKQMKKNGYISEDEYQRAINRPLSEILAPIQENEHQKYHEYIDRVIYEIQSKYHLDPFSESLVVYTNLDAKIQDYIIELEQNQQLYKDEQLQTAIVVIESQTGKIIAIGGGRNYHASLQFNYATDALIQPGSTIKPILDYGPAIEYLNYSPGTTIIDEKIYYNTLGSRYMPIKNYDNRYRGTMTLREALIDSRNTTAVKVFREVGDQAYQFAERFGLTFNDNKTEANALGGFEHGFSVLTMASAYTVFASGGYYVEPSTIHAIYHKGQDITFKPKPEKVIRDETAYLITDILHDNMIRGTAYRANISNQYIAGKTGQTNFDSKTQTTFNIPSNAVKDSWFIGYSNLYTTAVWIGYDKIKEHHYLTPTEAKLSLDLFKKVMATLHEEKQSTPPSRPESIVEVEIELASHPVKLASIYTPPSYRKKELFIKGYEPTEISNQIKPLTAPQDIIVYYDESVGQVILSWQKQRLDYDNTEYNLMQQVHALSRFYDGQKSRLLYEYYNEPKNYPSYTKNQAMMEKIRTMCRSSEHELCSKSVATFSYSEHITMFNLLNEFEQKQLLRNLAHLSLLSEAEISDIKTMQQKLGSLVYTITFNNGLIETPVYTGPYQTQIAIIMPLEEFVQYRTFSITCDFEKYPDRLKSPKRTILNPFYDII